MENNNKEEKKKCKKRRVFNTVLLVAGTVAICYEAFERKGQDVKKVIDWAKSKIQSKKEQEPRRENNNNWQGKRRN